METHGYTKEGHAYYKVHPGKAFDEALWDCANQGAELFSLKTEDDYAYARNAQFPPDSWVGKSLPSNIR